MTPRLPPDLLCVLASMDDAKKLALVLQDLLTAAEITSIRERWEIVKLLSDGRSQREVSQLLGVSVTTVTRGSKQLKYGDGGFELALNAAAHLQRTGRKK